MVDTAKMNGKEVKKRQPYGGGRWRERGVYPSKHLIKISPETRVKILAF